ncbi:hypothetical protein ACFY0G_38995 [Streptomyces sp. NPDC001552]|uniref:hypothetical protein n=1 Tax=Streptomyces sp. NPDC001552 TaxID=3364587 RepID=UPI0036BC2789
MQDASEAQAAQRQRLAALQFAGHVGEFGLMADRYAGHLRPVLAGVVVQSLTQGLLHRLRLVLRPGSHPAGCRAFAP